MCLCPKTQRIYFLGRYVDPELRNSAPLDNDFYVYHIDSHSWTLLSSNTEIDGGPRLSFDFEMCVDSDQQMLYVFGGRTLSLDSCECVLSGLYRYDIEERHWTVLRHDVLPNETDAPLRTRMERSMLFDPVARRLLIISAQRDSHCSREFSLYDIETDTVYEKVTAPTHSPLYSDKRYTHRATYDCQRQEVHIFTGRTDKPPVTMDRSDASEVSNTLWTYHVPTERWTEVYTTHHAPTVGSKGLGQPTADRPRPSLAAHAATRYPEAKSLLAALCPGYAHYFESSGGTDRAGQRHHSQGPLWNHSPCLQKPAMTTATFGKKAALSSVQGKPVCPAEPEPRIAHHFVYDSQSGTHYLFGGTALPLLAVDMPPLLDGASDGLPRSGAGYFQGSTTGIVSTKRAPLQAGHRLDDLWQLGLTKPTGVQIQMYLQFLVRRQRYLEMCLGLGLAGDGERQRATWLLTALEYLQGAVYPVVDTQDPAQLQQFHDLAPALLTAWPTSATVCEQMVHAARCCLYEELLTYLPRATKQPPGQLADVVVPWLEAQHAELA
ncbi:hypothetical protein H4R34_001575 [Dimargaris verticillata]|uniref:Muskelin N-terminal domain-containing protein n=1 Tax=Dimargaris verticillata TaxID=2761393 RepID=A0A9W8B4E8_9FUNG|nr:hypothetical protein H4R34_001575 [Dimargaris verticillata]